MLRGAGLVRRLVSSAVAGDSRHCSSVLPLLQQSLYDATQQTTTSHPIVSPSGQQRSLATYHQATLGQHSGLSPLGLSILGLSGASASRREAGSTSSSYLPPQPLHVRYMSQLTRRRMFKSAAIKDVPFGNNTDLYAGKFGIRALTGRRVAANTIEAVRRVLRRRIKKTARLWIRVRAIVPVTRKPEGIRMGKGKGSISFYATAVRPGQIIFEMDRLPRKVALQALEAIQPKFPCKLGFVEYS